MHSCHSTPRCWTGPELSKQKPTRNKGSTEHSAYASFFPPFASRAVGSELLLRTHSVRLRRLGGGKAPVLNQGYPHSENEERTNITYGQLRFTKALSFSARFSIFPSHALTYFVHFSWPRFTSPQFAAAVDMLDAPRNGNQVEAAKPGSGDTRKREERPKTVRAASAGGRALSFDGSGGRLCFFFLVSYLLGR